MKLSTRILTILAATAMALPASAASWDVDNGHSMAVFRVTHLGVGAFWGVLHHVTGSAEYDAAKPEASSLKLAIQSDSVFTADKKRDAHLKSPDFFNAKEFPTMTFASTAVKANGKNLQVTGTLTIRGKSKQVTADVAVIGTGKDPWGNTRVGFEAKLTIKRSEFGMNFMPGGLGEEVQLTIALEAIQKK